MSNLLWCFETFCVVLLVLIKFVVVCWIQKYECPTCKEVANNENLRKARNLFVNNEKEKEEISVYNNDDFPPLGS